MKKLKKSIAHFLEPWWAKLLIVIIIALFLRLVGLDWDNGQYLHPDERFLAMVTTALQWPKNIAQYFDPVHSPLNPYNQNFSFFVYGRFPIIFVKFIGELTQLRGYGDVRIIGRTLSALADASVCVAIFLGIRNLLTKKTKDGMKIALFSALTYAVFVLPIQQSHFFTVDSFVTAFFAWSVVCALYKRNVLAGIFFGLAMASKINAVLALPLLLVIFLLHAKKHQYLMCIARIALFLLVTYFTLRIADPYLFQTKNIFDARISVQFLANIRELQSYSTRGTFFPPAVQWETKPLWFSLQNLFFFGVGPIFFILSIVGLVKASFAFQWKKVSIICATCLLWAVVFFVYQSVQPVKSMRYIYFLYPFLAIGVGYFLANSQSKWIRAGLFFIGFLWTASFIHIYTVPNTRIQASQWMYQNMPDQSTIAWENWDDPLPLLLPNMTKQLPGIALDVFGPDSPQKWQINAEKLSHAGYLSLSSNRAWGSMSTDPKSYPIATRYYQLLFQGKLGFTKVAEFTSYPQISLFGLSYAFPDDWSEEAFTVYDHPKVMIFKRDPHFDAGKFLKLILK